MVIGGWSADGIAEADGICELPFMGMVMPGIGPVPIWLASRVLVVLEAWSGAGFFFAGAFFLGAGSDGIVIPGMCMCCARRGAAPTVIEAQSRSETVRRKTSPRLERTPG